MLSRIRLVHRVAVLTALAAVLSATVLASAETPPPLPACSTPQPQAPAFAPGTSNTITWTIPSGPTGTNFEIEIATASAIDPDGSFVDANLKQPRITIAASQGEREFTGLDERTYYYHMRSRAKTGICVESPWSGTVTTTQDATSPFIEITTTEPSAHVLDVVIKGIATDPIPASGSPASGAHQVAVALAHATPLGTLVFTDQPPSTTVDVHDDGSWEARIPEVDPGIYVATAIASDSVGHASEEDGLMQVVVVNAKVPDQPSLPGQ